MRTCRNLAFALMCGILWALSGQPAQAECDGDVGWGITAAGSCDADAQNRCGLWCGGCDGDSPYWTGQYDCSEPYWEEDCGSAGGCWEQVIYCDCEVWLN